MTSREQERLFLQRQSMTKSVKNKNKTIELALQGQEKKIKVCEREYLFMASQTQEAAIASDGENTFSFPSQPFRFERIIADSRAYLLDRDGNPWTIHYDLDWHPQFRKDSLKRFMEYVYIHEDKDFDFSELNKVRGDMPLFCPQGRELVVDSFMKEMKEKYASLCNKNV